MTARNDLNACLSYKVVVVGDAGVGKSALTIQYFQKNFVENHDPTIEDSYVKNVEIDGQWCLLDVLDTAGQEEFSTMRDQYMRKGQGFIIVYSVTDPESFKKVMQFKTQINRAKDSASYPIILAANKIDLVSDRKVSNSEGLEFAKEVGLEYIETSAKNPPVNVDKIFHDLVRKIRQAPPITMGVRKGRSQKKKKLSFLRNLCMFSQHGDEK